LHVGIGGQGSVFRLQKTFERGSRTNLKMHFVFISTMASAQWGGSEELWSQAALRLQQEGYEVSASVACWPQLSPKVTALGENGINLFIQPSLQPSLPVKVWRKTKQYIGCNRPEFNWLLRQKPDLVLISQGGNRDGLEAMKFCRDAGLPFAAITHCNAESWWPTDRLGEEMTGAFLQARRFFCVSNHNLVLLERQLATSLPNSVVIWNPSNVSSVPPPPWPVDNGVMKIACVGRLEPSAKGQDLLLEALSKDPWHKRAFEINIYGGGSCEQGLRRLAKHLKLEKVHFRGHVADVLGIWRQNHLLVLPSRFEGLPLVLVEAMWCARPAVVTDIGGNAELCMDNETGFVAAAPALGLLEETLERAWNRRNDWQNMGKLARARAERLIPKDPVGEFCKQLVEIGKLEK
jgi:glycosyltransferase involved in cell wall biosynthesis